MPTYSVMATVVTRADMADDIVEALVASTLETLPALAIRAPVLAGLDPGEMREPASPRRCIPAPSPPSLPQ